MTTFYDDDPSPRPASRASTGKRALRVYPPWDASTSRQAQRTQAWQLQYFVDMSQGQAVDLERVKALLALQG